jgi:hypothetical protein
MAQREKETGKDFKLEPQTNGEKETRSDAGEWIPAFLATLRTTGNVYLSCRQAGITRKTAYLWKEKNTEFAKEWEATMEDAVDILEYSGWQRAKKISDGLMKFLLQAHRYGFKQQHELSGPDGKPIPVRDVITIVDDGEDED